MSTTATVTYTPGKFVWREHMTRDVAASKAFYGGLFGWRFEDAPMDGFTYTLVYAGQKQIAGMMDINQMQGAPADMPAHWGVYVSVDDVDAAAQRARDAGGAVHTGPMDIPGIGRFALISDPQGAMLFVYKNQGGDGEDVVGENGDFCWESLTTTSAEGAVKFYEQVVGWTTEYMEGGGMKTPLFTTKADKWVASVAQPPGEDFQGPCAWLTYVAVADLKASVAKAKELGGTVIVDHVPVPGMGAFAICTDVQGAFFCMFEAVPQG